MLSKCIQIGGKIELKSTQKTKQNIYYSKIVDLIDENKIKILMPIQNSKVIPLPIGTRYEIYLYSQRTLYQCMGTIIERYKEDKLYILVLKIESKLVKYQRRRYYRLECFLKLKYRVITEKEQVFLEKLAKHKFKSEQQLTLCLERLAELQSNWNSGMITDLSGGGIRFYSNSLHEKGEVFCICFSLLVAGETKVFKLKANVITSLPMKQKQGVYEQRLEFCEISEQEREIIIKYVFEEERHQMRKEKGLD